MRLPALTPELGSKMVLTVSAVAGIVVSEVGERRERVGEVELVDGSDYVIVRLREDKLLARLRSVHKDTVDARCTKVASGIVLSS